MLIFLGFLKEIYLIIHFLKILIYFNTTMYYRTYNFIQEYKNYSNFCYILEPI